MKTRFAVSIVYSLLIPVLLTLTAQGQNTGDQIRDALDKIEKGQTEEVRKMLPELVSKYQNDPAVFYIQGRCSSDGIEAVKFYQSVVDNFPASEWADDALYNIYQYYYALGL